MAADALNRINRLADINHPAREGQEVDVARTNRIVPHARILAPPQVARREAARKPAGFALSAPFRFFRCAPKTCMEPKTHPALPYPLPI